MKFIITLAWCVQVSGAFSSFPNLKTSAPPSLTTLSYEREDLHDVLHDEWRQNKGPQFKRDQRMDEASLADESLAIHFPEASTAAAASLLTLQVPSEAASSYQGLSNPSKAGLVLASALTLGMAAASPEIDLSTILDFPQLALSGDASAFVNAGMMTLERALQDAQGGWMQLSSNFAQTQWMELALVKLATWQEAATVNAEAVRASIASPTNVELLRSVQQECLAAVEASKDSAAVFAQASQAAMTDATSRLSELQSEALQEAQVWNGILMTNIDSSTQLMEQSMADSMQSIETSWIDTSYQLSEVQNNFMQDAQVWNQVLMTNVEASKETMMDSMQNVEASLNDANIRFEQAQSTFMQDAQIWYQALMAQVDGWKDSAAVGLATAHATLTDTTNYLSSQFQEMNLQGTSYLSSQFQEMNLQGTSEELLHQLDTSKDAVLVQLQGVTEGGIQQVDVLKSSFTLGMEEAHTTFSETSNHVSVALQDINLQEEASSWMGKVMPSRDSVLSTVSGWIGSLQLLF